VVHKLALFSGTLVSRFPLQKLVSTGNLGVSVSIRRNNVPAVCNFSNNIQFNASTSDLTDGNAKVWIIWISSGNIFLW